MADEPVPTDVLSDEEPCTLAELCETCGVEQDWVIELVEHGALEPTGRSIVEWQFASVAIGRVSRARRLVRDLDLNTPGVALALELLDEVEVLRSRLRALGGGD